MVFGSGLKLLLKETPLSSIPFIGVADTSIPQHISTRTLDSMTDRRLRSVVMMLHCYLDTNTCPQVLHTHIRRPPLFARSLSTCSVNCKFRRNGFTQASTATALDRIGPVTAWAWPFPVDLLYDLHLWFCLALFRSSNAYCQAPVS